MLQLVAKRLRVGVAGVGFIGQVHVRAAEMAGAEVVAVSGGNPERTAQTAAKLGISQVLTSDELVAADLDVLHICTPNNSHAPLAKAALEAGKHVICEKPLATSIEDAQELVQLANARGLVATVPFVYRFHPVAREARNRVRTGEVGDLRIIHGSYLQDWLALPTDYSWRVDPSQGGASQAFADIGSHWCDLVEFITGQRITRISARKKTTVPERVKSDAAAFGTSSGEGETVKSGGEDAVTVMFETDGGAMGSLVVSQVSHGRKNRLWIEIDGASEAIVFDQEDVEHLWVGRRDGTYVVNRDPSTLSDPAARYATLPAGHAQGYDGCFNAFVADTYAAVQGNTVDGLPTFADGLRAAVITNAVLESANDQSWKELA